MNTLGQEILRDKMAPWSTGVKLANAHEGLERLSRGEDSANLTQDINWFGSLLQYATPEYRKSDKPYECDCREITIVRPSIFRAMETRSQLTGFNRDWYRLLAENPKALSTEEIKLAKHFAESIFHDIDNEVKPNLDGYLYLSAA